MNKATGEDTPVQISIPTGVPILLRDLLHEQTGVFFENDRLDLLLEKLEERVRVRGFSSFLDYFYLLKYEPDAEPEWRRVMDALCVPETYFWREAAQFRVMVDQLAPVWRKRMPAPLRIWSAACATGEEPYSLAIALGEAGWGGDQVEIVASDASEAALGKARAAIYRERSFRALPPHLRAKYFDPPQGDGSRLRTELLPGIRFQQANLVHAADVASLANTPLVFCRNVFIYFSSDAIRRTIANFAAAMPDGGHLFVGASESLLKLTNDFELQEVGDSFVYVRVPRQP